MSFWRKAGVGIVALGITLAGTAQAAVSQAAVASPAAVDPAVAPGPHVSVSRALAQSAAGATIPMWSSTVVASQDGKRYRYTMVGQNPALKLANPVTTITVNVIPVVLKFSDGTTLDPTKTSCSETVSPLASVLASPVFTGATFSPGGTVVGKTQYGDAFQRANFWKYTNPAGLNPKYHLLLKPKVTAALTIKVPAADGTVDHGSGCPLADVSESYSDAVGLKLIPTLKKAAYGVTPKTFPIFLFHNVRLDQPMGVPDAVGFHAAVPNPAFAGATQTVAVASYLDGSVRSNESDIAVLSHEVAEWIDDPLANNPTPAWGNTGQVGATKCQKNLEVGDPLTGTTFPITLKGVTYHPQELAFFSWFYGPTPSIAVNGSYSFSGTFTHPAPLCPPGGP